jgi:hypothetical protein
VDVKKSDTSKIECCYVCDNTGSHFEDARIICTLDHGPLSLCGDHLPYYFDVCSDFKRRVKL